MLIDTEREVSPRQVLNKANMGKVLLGLLCLIAIVAAQDPDYYFPDGFKFGAATSAPQVEGGWDANGKGMSVWDKGYLDNPWLAPDGIGPNVACDSYNLFREDVQMLKTLGANFYRFSISWPRVLPNGHADNVNPDGIRYYNDLINELLANGIEPYVTMFHWDLPQALQEELTDNNGGWTDRRIIDLFVDYARVLFQNFGDRVKVWMTFNEILQICEKGYSDGDFAPFIANPGIGGYQCTHNVLLSHGRAFRMYDAEFRSSQQGRIGMAIDSYWHEPNYADSASDQAAAEFVLQMYYGWFVQPVFQRNYPQVMIDRVADYSAREGFPQSRLPAFSEEELNMLSGSYDFMGLNQYSADKSYFAEEWAGSHPSHWADTAVEGRQEDDWWMGVPWGLRKLLVWIKDHYGNPPMLITENGFSQGEDDDYNRANYHKNYLYELLKAIHEEGCNVIGYTVWALMDNWEWRGGLTIRMGLFHVDYNSPQKTRTRKLSSYVYENIITTRHIDWNYYPDWPPAFVEKWPKDNSTTV